MNELELQDLIFDLSYALVKVASQSLVEDRTICELLYNLNEEVKSNSLSIKTLETVIKAIKEA